MADSLMKKSFADLERHDFVIHFISHFDYYILILLSSLCREIYVQRLIVIIGDSDYVEVF